MKAFFSETHTLHAPHWYVADGGVRPCPDLPTRVDAIRKTLAAIAAIRLTPPGNADPWPAIRAVHAADYLEYLQTIHAVWTAEFGPHGGPEVIPDTFVRHLASAGHRPCPRPTKPSAQAGWYCFDLAAPITAGTWEAAVESARCAVSAADAILQGEAAAYALCRPPGHHAGPDYCGGFCYLNNAAIAAQHLLLGGKRRVAILDIDYHHGNGTQDIFYQRPDVLFVSIHADPNTQYPYFWGHAEETGTGEGLGFNANYPLPRGATEDLWMATLDKALDRLRDFDPEAFVVSLGVDIVDGDSIGDFHISPDGFTQIGRRLAALDLPTVIVQEGGYNLHAIGPSVAAVLQAFLQ